MKRSQVGPILPSKSDSGGGGQILTLPGNGNGTAAGLHECRMSLDGVQRKEKGQKGGEDGDLN